MPNQDYYQGYYDYFSPGGGGKNPGLYNAWGLIDKYQQDPSQLQGQQLKDAQWWMGQNAGQNYANPWNFASTHYNLYPTGPHAKRYDAYLQAGGGGGKNPGAPGAPGGPAPLGGADDDETINGHFTGRLGLHETRHGVHGAHSSLGHGQAQGPFLIATLQILVPRVGDDGVLGALAFFPGENQRLIRHHS